MSAKLFSEVVDCNQCNASGPAREHLGHDTQGFGGRLRFCPCCLDVFYTQMNCVTWSSLCCDSCNRKAEETEDREFLARYDRAEMRKRAYLKYHTINNKVVRLVERAAARLEAARRRAEVAAAGLETAPVISVLDGEDCGRGHFRFSGNGWRVEVTPAGVEFFRLVEQLGKTAAEWAVVTDKKFIKGYGGFYECRDGYKLPDDLGECWQALQELPHREAVILTKFSDGDVKFLKVEKSTPGTWGGLFVGTWKPGGTSYPQEKVFTDPAARRR